jgi:hypothetical protein
MNRRSPDLVILCSRRPNTVTARVFGGVLVATTRTTGATGTIDLRNEVPADWHVRRIACRCGTEHYWWSAPVLLGERGRITTERLEQLTNERDEAERNR